MRPIHLPSIMHRVRLHRQTLQSAPVRHEHGAANIDLIDPRRATPRAKPNAMARARTSRSQARRARGVICLESNSAGKSKSAAG
jgi:hypothetical protein